MIDEDSPAIKGKLHKHSAPHAPHPEARFFLWVVEEGKKGKFWQRNRKNKPMATKV